MIGFDGIKSTLLRQHQQNKLHHGLLFHGKKGIGKASFAKELALTILGGQNTDHPDLLIIEKEKDKKEISVNKIREIASFLNQTSAISKYKFIIVDSADELNKSSANALLKTLEEPHPNNFLILISHNPNKVMTTIKSRCHAICIADLSFENFVKIIKENAPDIADDEINVLAEICDNSPAKALQDGQALIDIYEALLNSLEHQIIDDELLKKITDKSFDFNIIIESLTFFFHRLITFLNGGTVKFYFDEKDIFLYFKNKLTLREIFDLYDNIRNSLQKNKSLNLDRKLTFINIFNQLNV